MPAGKTYTRRKSWTPHYQEAESTNLLEADMEKIQSGTVIMAAGATTAAVTFSPQYAVAPPSEAIHITPLGDWLAATKWRIDPASITTTGFNIVASVAPGGAGLLFGWHVIPH